MTETAKKSSRTNTASHQSCARPRKKTGSSSSLRRRKRRKPSFLPSLWEYPPEDSSLPVYLWKKENTHTQFATDCNSSFSLTHKSYHSRGSRWWRRRYTTLWCWLVKPRWRKEYDIVSFVTTWARLGKVKWNKFVIDRVGWSMAFTLEASAYFYSQKSVFLFTNFRKLKNKTKSPNNFFYGLINSEFPKTPRSFDLIENRLPNLNSGSKLRCNTFHT